MFLAQIDIFGYSALLRSPHGRSFVLLIPFIQFTRGKKPCAASNQDRGPYL